MRRLMQTARPIAEDLAGTAVFYLLFLATGSAVLSAAVGLAIGVGQLAWHRWRRIPVPTLLAMGVALTISMGVLTLWTHDPRFLLLKPSIVLAAIGATMLPRGWLTRYVPEVARDLLGPQVLARAGWAWATLMFASAALNIALVALLPAREAAATFALWAVGSKLALFAGQYVVLRARAMRAYRAREAAAG